MAAHRERSRRKLLPTCRRRCAGCRTRGVDSQATVERDSGNEDLTGLFPDQPVGEQTPSGRVLLVDDNLDMREYVQRLLARNYTVIPARDGQEALELARANPPDLVLTDVMMPRMDGFQLLKALREDPRTQLLPVIMLSARAGEESRVEGLEAGADDYLVKPFTARELMARVGAHLSMKKMREEFRHREQKEQRRAEAAETQYQRILESISDGFLFVDSDWTIRHCNTVYATYARSSKSDLIGKNLWEQFPETAGTRFGEQYRDAMLNQKEAEIEDYYEPLDAWFRVHLYPTADGLAMFVCRRDCATAAASGIAGLGEAGGGRTPGQHRRSRNQQSTGVRRQSVVPGSPSDGSGTARAIPGLC